MPQRKMTAETYRFLEWGQATSTPRSRVFDAMDRYVFTGSRVQLMGSDRVGSVAGLASERSVLVRWSEAFTESVDPARLVVVALPGRTAV